MIMQCTATITCHLSVTASTMMQLLIILIWFTLLIHVTHEWHQAVKGYRSPVRKTLILHNIFIIFTLKFVCTELQNVSIYIETITRVTSPAYLEKYSTYRLAMLHKRNITVRP